MQIKKGAVVTRKNIVALGCWSPLCGFASVFAILLILFPLCGSRPKFLKRANQGPTDGQLLVRIPEENITDQKQISYHKLSMPLLFCQLLIIHTKII